jgi:hypothetical protein
LWGPAHTTAHLPWGGSCAAFDDGTHIISNRLPNTSRAHRVPHPKPDVSVHHGTDADTDAQGKPVADAPIHHGANTQASDGPNTGAHTTTHPRSNNGANTQASDGLNTGAHTTTHPRSNNTSSSTSVFNDGRKSVCTWLDEQEGARGTSFAAEFTNGHFKSNAMPIDVAEWVAPP